MAKYMINWHIPSGHYAEALDRFEQKGAPTPPGLKLLGRWHEPGSGRGYILVETDDPAIVAKHLMAWNDLVEHRTVPVIEDEEVPSRP